MMMMQVNSGMIRFSFSHVLSYLSYSVLLACEAGVLPIMVYHVYIMDYQLSEFLMILFPHSCIKEGNLG